MWRKSKTRGEIIFKSGWVESYITEQAVKVYTAGDRIGQIIILPYPQVEFVEVDKLSDSERGEGGFGSSGE